MAEEGYYYNCESRFVCKLCNKKYPCGKSLGGHMRSHVAANSAESDHLFERKISSFVDFDPQNYAKDSKVVEFVNGQHSSYVLRENPRKTWRAADTSRLPLPQDKICKQCGKGFQSMKALCGHMACHSERDKNSKDDGSWTSENQRAIINSCSDTEEGDERRIRTRSSSKSNRYKKFVEKSQFLHPTYNNTSPNNNNGNGSSSVSDIDGQDHEEVALCLMLLSRDLGNNYSVVESSDNNSVVLETKSSSIEMRIGKMENLGYSHNQDEKKKIEKNTDNVKLKGKILEDESAQVEDINSDSGYFLDECTKADSNLSVDFRNSLNYAEFESKKREYFTPESLEESCDNPRKKSKYECYNCKKSFKSYQALGGHRPCHKRTSASYEPRYEGGENSPDESTDYSKKKAWAKKTKASKGKDHVCPFCDRVFKNGQALGGHKRSHFITGHVENENRSRLVAKAEARGLLDLNLPAPDDDGDN